MKVFIHLYQEGGVCEKGILKVVRVRNGENGTQNLRFEKSASLRNLHFSNWEVTYFEASTQTGGLSKTAKTAGFSVS